MAAKTEQDQIYESLRNLPDWAKAEELYRIRYHYAISNASGMERFAFRVLPYSFWRSFALVFDPKEKFRIGNIKVTPFNRSRRREISSVLDSRYSTQNYYWHSVARSPVWCEYPLPESVAHDQWNNTSALPRAEPYSIESYDTTRKSRPPYSDQGTFKSFRYNLTIPDRSWNAIKTYDQRIYGPPCPLPAYNTSVEKYSGTTVGGAALFEASSLNMLKSSAYARAEEAFASNVPKMVASLLPSARRYSLARNLVELRDLPRSIRSLRTTLQDLSLSSKLLPSDFWQSLRAANVPKNLPNEWLSFWFGWRQVYKDVTDLLNAPAKISKDVNFLLSRRGKPTTIRSRRLVAGSGSDGPAFTLSPYYTPLGWTSDWPYDLKTQDSWNHEIRVVMNLIFDFPEVGLPKLRQDLFLRKIGLQPTFTDLYNLVPWTWLIDWFTGLGDYVELIDEINTDRSLINWALATCVTTGKLRTTVRYEYENIQEFVLNDDFVNHEPVRNRIVTKVSRPFSFDCDYTVHIRKNVSEGFGVKSTLDLANLSPYQASILGAILAQRTGITRT